MRLDLFVKLKYQSSTISNVGIKYPVRDLLCDITNYDPQSSNASLQ